MASSSSFSPTRLGTGGGGDQTWTCSQCTLINSVNVGNCLACERSNPAVAAAAQQQSSGFHSPSQAAHPHVFAADPMMSALLQMLFAGQGIGLLGAGSQVAQQPPAVIPTGPRQRLWAPKCPIRMGTSGYSFKWWHDHLGYYPTKDEFGFYCGEYNSVELNNTYYNIPVAATWKNWAKKAPRPSFVYTVKANKYFTHSKKLTIDEAFTDRWEEFWEKCQHLGKHLGPVLFQFPPQFKCTAKTFPRLEQLAKVLDKNARFAFEFRDPSWYTDEVYEVLKKNNWCLCVIECCNNISQGKKTKWVGDMPSGMTPANFEDHQTCDWGVYYRFHGSTGQYTGAHGQKAMRSLAEETATRFLTDAKKGFRLYFYFNNTDDGKPPSCHQDARHLASAFKDMQVMAREED